MPVKEATFTAYVRRNGKVTVPRGVRDMLGIKEGDLVECKIKKVQAARAR